LILVPDLCFKVLSRGDDELYVYTEKQREWAKQCKDRKLILAGKTQGHKMRQSGDELSQ